MSRVTPPVEVSAPVARPEAAAPGNAAWETLLLCIQDAGLGTVPWSRALALTAEALDARQVLLVSPAHACPIARSHPVAGTVSVRGSAPGSGPGDNPGSGDASACRGRDCLDCLTGEHSGTAAESGPMLQARLGDDASMPLLVARQPAGRDDFTATQAQWFDRLREHYSRALEIERRQREAEVRQHAHTLLLDNSPYGVLILGEGLQVLGLNARASRLLEAGTPLSVRRDRHGVERLHVASQGARDALRWHLEEQAALRIAPAVAEPSAGVSSRNTVLRLVCNDGAAGLIVSLTPLSPAPGHVPVGGEPRLALTLSRVDACDALDPDALQGCFEFTPAELRVALAVCRGQSLPELSVTSGLSANTLKTQLQAVYAKTGTSKQSALVGKLLAVGLLHAMPAADSAR